MINFGNALLPFYHLAGLLLCDLLEAAIGVKTNIGGADIAMLRLIFPTPVAAQEGLAAKGNRSGRRLLGATSIRSSSP